MTKKAKDEWWLMTDDHGGGNGQLHSAWYMRGTHGWTLYTYTLSAKGTGGERSYTDLDFVTTVAITNISNQIILHFSCFVPLYFPTAHLRCPSYIFLCDSPCTKDIRPRYLFAYRAVAGLTGDVSVWTIRRRSSLPATSDLPHSCGIASS
jgi:hypothetical protein